MPNISAHQIYFALADSSRYRILNLIIEQAANFNAYETRPLSLNYSKKLAQLSRLSPSTVAHHLKILKQADLVYILKKGRLRFIFPQENRLKLLGEFGKELLEKYHGLQKYQLAAEIPFLNASQEKLQQAMTFLSIHGFHYYGPTNFVDNAEAFKYLIIKRGETKGFLEIIYNSKEQKLYLNKPVLSYDWIKHKLPEIKNKLEEFILKKLKS